MILFTNVALVCVYVCVWKNGCLWVFGEGVKCVRMYVCIMCLCVCFGVMCGCVFGVRVVCVSCVRNGCLGACVCMLYMYFMCPLMCVVCVCFWCVFWVCFCGYLVCVMCVCNWLCGVCGMCSVNVWCKCMWCVHVYGCVCTCVCMCMCCQYVSCVYVRIETSVFRTLFEIPSTTKTIKINYNQLSKFQSFI